MNQILGFLLAVEWFIFPSLVLLLVCLTIMNKQDDIGWRIKLLYRPSIRLGHEITTLGVATVVPGNMMKPMDESKKS